MAEIKADEKGIEDYEGEMLRLKQRKAFLEARIVENKAWAANYDEHFGPFVNKYKEFMEQVSSLSRVGMLGLIKCLLGLLFLCLELTGRALWLACALILTVCCFLLVSRSCVADVGVVQQRQGQACKWT